jgi:hypothetical protein
MRHAYWRRPDGKIHKADDDSYAPTALLRTMGMAATLNAQGNASWPMDKWMHNELAVCSSITLLQPDSTELNEADSNAIVEQAVIQVIKKDGGQKPINPKSLLRCVERIAKSHFAKPTNERLLVSSISVEKCDILPIDMFGSTLNIVERSNYPFPSALTQISSFVSSHVKRSTYTVISASTNEISWNQAFDRGMTAINCLRGIWNLKATFCGGGIGWSTVPKRTWLGVVHVGPIHALYLEDGTSEGECYWHEPDYVEDAKLFKPNEGWDKFNESSKWIFQSIAASPMKADLISLFARYAVALDQRNLDVAFLMLWSLLEKITNTVGSNYDETIKRVVWPFSDRENGQDLLNHMRLRRNQFVHSATTSDARDQLCHMTKRFVDKHLGLLLQNGFSVSSLTEYGEFVSLPHNLSRLQHLVDVYKRAFDLQVEMEQREC